MTNRHPDLEVEQAYIDHAYECLDAARSRATRLRSMVEVGSGGTFQARYERDVIEGSVQQRLANLQLGSASLVFGRIDTTDDDTFHIGRLAVADDHQNPVVVDWRAPVAEPFYRATGRDPMGLRRRRHFATRGRTLLDIDDEVFDLAALERGDIQGYGALLASLDQHRTGYLTDIVATIQGEQDEVIRDDLRGVVVVQGGPGTGKTVVALHRAAYLLYTHRFPLEGQGVLVVGPNRLFLRYVEQVLPSLGEAGVRLATLADVVADALGDVPLGAVDRPATAELKGDMVMADLVRRAIRDRERALRDELVVGFGVGQVRLGVERSARIVAEARRRFHLHNSGRRFVEEEVFAALAASHSDRLEQGEVARRLRADPLVQAALEWMWPVLTPGQLLRDLYGSRPLLRSAARGVLSEEQAMLLYRSRGRDAEDYLWSESDVPVLDDAYDRLGPRRTRAGVTDPPVRQWGHIVVDEAQDLTPMALSMLTARSLKGSFTIVGDIAQATAPGAASSWDDVLVHLPTGNQPVRKRQLTLGYRIPGPSMVLAARVLGEAAPDLEPPRSVRETGDPPRLVHIEDGAGLADALVRTVAEERTALGGGSVAVIAPQSLIADLDAALAAAGVDYGLAATAGRTRGRGLHPEVNLVAVHLVKGLELDGAIVVEPGRIVAEEPQGLRALYVALTRATRRLTLIHAEPLPAVLEE